MSEKTIRWGVLGPGGIAKRFAAALPCVPNAALQAVASRDIEKARDYARKFGAQTAYGSYIELACDPDMDAVYVATPHIFHCEQAILCMEHGKHVLCEKPMAINAAEERRMVETARKNHVFLMEAMWTRFLPSSKKIMELLAAGRIGEPRMMTADFSFGFGVNPEHRLYNPGLAGGALLDVGIYVMEYASMVFGPNPEKITSAVRIGETGVDENESILLQYPGGKIASLTCGVHACGTSEAHIMGTEGRITASPFWKAESVKLTDKDGGEEVFSFPFPGDGFLYEIIEAGDCIRKGLPESPGMTLAESIAVMESMDAMREGWGLSYPTEKEE